MDTILAGILIVVVLIVVVLIVVVASPRTSALAKTPRGHRDGAPGTVDGGTASLGHDANWHGHGHGADISAGHGGDGGGH